MEENIRHKDFINQLRFQVRGTVPEKYHNEEIYIRDNVYEYAVKADKKIESNEAFDEDEAVCTIQLISEWVFHKTIDMLESDIPRKLHKKLLDKIFYEIYEFSKVNSIKKNETKYLNNIENLVNRSFEKSIKELFEQNKINETVYKKALNCSNIDIMWKENTREISISVYRNLKEKFYVSAIFIITLITYYISIILNLCTGQKHLAYLLFAIFCVLLWRFLVYRKDIEVPVSSGELSYLQISLWNILKGHPCISILSIILMQFSLILTFYLFYKSFIIGSVAAIILFLISLAGFLCIKINITYFYKDNL